MRAVLLVCTLLVLTGSLRAQTVDAVVVGRVVNGETQAPLADAHVFLDGSTYGDVTDEAGRFRLSGFPAGTYTLVVSMVGYESISLGMRLSGIVDETLRIELAPHVHQLGEVEIVGLKPADWDAQLGRFKRHFIGESDWADETALLNPEMLSFEESEEAFTAQSTTPLVVENRALGYMLTYLLDEFAQTPDLVRYRGRVAFEELEPRNGRERRRWRRARSEAYQGSLRHVLHAIATGEGLDQFEFYLTDKLERFEFLDLSRLGRETVPGRAVDPAAIATPHGADYVLRFPDYLCVIYVGEARQVGSSSYPGARSAERLYEQEVSWIRLSPDAHAGAVFDESGRLHDPYAVYVFGVMGDRRVAEQLPWDYRP